MRPLSCTQHTPSDFFVSQQQIYRLLKTCLFLVWDMSLRVLATDLQYITTFFSSGLDMASVLYRMRQDRKSTQLFMRSVCYFSPILTDNGTYRKRLAKTFNISTVHLVYCFYFNHQCTINIFILSLYYNHNYMFRYICIIFREFKSSVLTIPAHTPHQHRNIQIVYMTT